MRVLQVLSSPSPEVPTLTVGPTLQREGDPVYGNCRSGRGAALLWAPSEIPGVPGLCWLSCHLWACDVCLLLRLCLSPPQPTLRRLTRPLETRGDNWAAKCSRNGYRPFSHPKRELPAGLVQSIGQQVSSHTLKKSGRRYRRVETVTGYITSKLSERPETPVF